MECITDMHDVAGKTVLVRVDFNVPVEGRIITDDFRIRSAMQTIEFLRGKGAKVILMSHFENKETQSLEVVATYLHTFFPVTFMSDIMAEDVREHVVDMASGDIMLLENLRLWDGEKENSQAFAKYLASLADVYVNEAFSASHRKHASIVGVPKYLEHYAGIHFKKEVDALSEALSPEPPFLFILGGAKFSTKLPLLQKYLEKADTVVVAGALMNNFYKEKGYDVKDSLVEEGDYAIQEMLGHKHLYLPKDVVAETKDGSAEVKDPSKLEDGDVIMDVGPRALVDLQTYINQARSIVWNGPLGNYEKGYGEGTRELAHRIAEGAKESVIGGGDTLSVVGELQLFEKFSFVSSAGGAMLDFLAHETLPGIEAIN